MVEEATEKTAMYLVAMRLSLHFHPQRSSWSLSKRKATLQLSFRVQYKVKATSSIFSLSTVSLFANQVVSTHLKLGHMSTNVSTLDLLVVAATCGVRKSNYLSWRQLVCISMLMMILERSCRWIDVGAAFCVITREHGKENK